MSNFLLNRLTNEQWERRRKLLWFIIILYLIQLIIKFYISHWAKVMTKSNLTLPLTINKNKQTKAKQTNKKQKEQEQEQEQEKPHATVGFPINCHKLWDIDFFSLTTIPILTTVIANGVQQWQIVGWIQESRKCISMTFHQKRFSVLQYDVHRK